ncbi:MAG: DMT family transporter, partial [Rubricella sp.]
MTLLPDAQDTRSVGRGILLMLGAILFFTWMDAIANRLTQTLDPLQVVWARYLGQVVATFIVLAPRLGAVFPTRRWRVQILRSVLLFGATFSFYTALSGLEIAEATAIFEVAPLMLTGLAVILLGEKVGLRRWLGVGAGLVGALIIIRPGTDVF